jgi:hypothetical protein
MQLEVQHLTIEQVFRDFYEVPRYQREYVWQKEQVEALLSDALDGLFDENGSPTQSEYFIGSIVAYKDKDVFDLIDGQQRITTLFMVLCALRDRRIFLKDEVSLNTLAKMIQDEKDDQDGIPEIRLRLKPLYDDAGDVLQKIARGSIPSSDKGLPKSGSNMLAAYLAAHEFLKEQFGEDIDKLRRFQAGLTQRVLLVRIQTVNIADALRIFETINDRGVSLNSLDLLKNLLFREAKQDEFGQLTKIWQEMIRTIEEGKGEKPLRFLRYFVLSRYADAREESKKPIVEESLYKWFDKVSGEIGLSQHPVAYAKQLLAAAKIYKQHVVTPNEHLNNIYQLSGRARQHLIVMLATDGLEQDEVLEVAKQMESLFVAFILTKEPTKALDMIFAEEAPKLRQFVEALNKEKDAAGQLLSSQKRDERLREYLAAWVQPELKQRFNKIEQSLDQLSLERKTVCRFVLSRVAQHVEKSAHPQMQVDRIQRYWKLHIEHILPNNPSPEQRAEFDDAAKYDDYKQRLGNLTLLEAPINCAIGRDYFVDKRPAYEKSNLFITRSIAKSQAVGSASTFTKTAALLPNFTEWNSTSISERHKHLKKLALETWAFVV